MQCMYYRAELRFVAGAGWVHPGGGVYVQRCRACGLVSDRPSQSRCPRCGSALFVDDHCALPDRARSAAG